jgi:hypothetical protein
MGTNNDKKWWQTPFGISKVVGLVLALGGFGSGAGYLGARDTTQATVDSAEARLNKEVDASEMRALAAVGELSERVDTNTEMIAVIREDISAIRAHGDNAKDERKEIKDDLKAMMRSQSEMLRMLKTVINDTGGSP